MKVKDLKALLDRLPDDTDVLAESPFGAKAVSFYESHAVPTSINPPWHHNFIMTIADAGLDKCMECGMVEAAHEAPPGLMADSDRRSFLIISMGHPGTPQFLKDNAKPCLVVDVE
jgi:hypothetical protein